MASLAAIVVLFLVGESKDAGPSRVAGGVIFGAGAPGGAWG
jgi:hypothetical protein